MLELVTMVEEEEEEVAEEEDDEDEVIWTSEKCCLTLPEDCTSEKLSMMPPLDCTSDRTSITPPMDWMTSVAMVICVTFCCSQDWLLVSFGALVAWKDDFYHYYTFSHNKSTST